VSARPGSSRQLWWLAAGFTVWCSALVTLYAIHGIGCAFAWSAGSLRLWLAVALLAHMGVLAWIWYVTSRIAPDPGFGSTGAFIHWAVTGTAIAALAATAVTLGPPLLLATCI